MITRLAKKFLNTNKNRIQGNLTGTTHQNLLTKSIFYNFGKFNKEQVSVHRGELSEFNENTLWDIPGAKKKKKIKGRGRASGKGKTAGFGHKGQGQRRTKKHPRFEGGQNPLYNRLPKIRLRQIDEVYEYVTIERLLYGIKRGWINPENEITIRDLVRSGLIAKPTYGVILRSKGHEKLNIPLNIEVSEAESEAIDALQSQGGSVAIVYMTRARLSQHLNPEKRSKYILEDPIPPTHKLERYTKLYKKGCDMRVKFPQWLLEDLEAGKEIEEFHREFEFPVHRYPGMGKDRVRKRKEVIEKTIKFDFLNK